MAALHAGLSGEQWAEGILRGRIERIERIVEHSPCWGLFHGAEQVGFIRALTDYCAFADLDDLYILRAYREACRSG